MLHMIGHAIFGLIIGLLARAVMPGRLHGLIGGADNAKAGDRPVRR